MSEQRNERPTMLTDPWAADGFSDAVTLRRALLVEMARERYGDLVDKKFGASLGVDEERELKELKQTLDRADAPFYEPVKQRLRAELERLEAQRDESNPG
jgi:hypothetical protein